MAAQKVPMIKFLKSGVADILEGKKTLEPRPRSLAWIRRLEKAEMVHLTYGPRMGAPTIFATAKIERIEIRPFDSIEKEDLKRIAYGWENRTPTDFIREYNNWYSKELAKGYPVAWIYFSIHQEPTA